MADHKPEDLAPLTNPAAEPWQSKEYSSGGGNDEDKVFMGYLDEFKDQAALESSIPLSPQWLYAKSNESKPPLSAAPGETRPPNSLPQGTLVDSIQRDAWRPEGSQDKKEWKRNVLDVESSRRWHEEERETGLLGRRERRKEGDRENEYRKNDRRDNVSMRETTDSRPVPSSDRWNESRRDSKWSSRWGPEDKEKDSRMEKKTDADKEDNHVEKQPIIGGNRPVSESDSRDKWKPRHRQEIHSGGAAVYRAAPGFGVDRGRVEGPNVGFAPGRGKSRPSSSGPIGAAPSVINKSLHGKSNLYAGTYRYPRGKILDIYRKNKMLSPFDSIPEGFEEVSQITQSSSVAPLAFVKPDSEEEAVLEDIWKGKVISSEVYCDSHRENVRASDREIDSDVGKYKTNVNAVSNGKDHDGITSAVSKDDTFSNIAGGLIHSDKKDDLANMENSDECVGLSEFLNDAKSGSVNLATSLDISTKLPDDSNSLFITSFIQETLSTDIQHQNRNPEREPIEQSISSDLSLFYLDPQSEIQGPFLAEDILSWYDEGFFGTDLPVILSDAAEGTPFQPLGKLIPYLSLKSQTPSEQIEQSDTTRGNLEAMTPASEISKYFALNDQQWQGSDGSFSHQVQHRIPEPEVSLTSHYELTPFSKPEISGGIHGSERQSFRDLSGQDAEEVLYMGRSVNSVQNPLGNLVNEIRDLSRTPSGHQDRLSATGQDSSKNSKVLTDIDVNPLGLSWSELEGTHHKGPLSSNIAGVGDRVDLINPLAGTDASLFRQKQDQFSAIGNSEVHDAWSGYNRRNFSSNVLQDALDANHLANFESDSNRFTLEEHLLAQQFQKLQLQQQHSMFSPNQNLHLSGSYMEQLQGPLHRQQSINQSIPHREHLLKLQLQQQRHLQQLEREEQLRLHQQQQQQQLHHQMQLLQQQHQHQHQQHQHQLLLEQMLRQNLHDPNFGVPRVDPLRGENTLDQLLYRQQLLHELQQQAQHFPLNHDPSLDQLIQAKLGHNLHLEHQNGLLDALSHPDHRHMLPLEQQLLGLQQDQLQARQFPRQQSGIDDERHVGEVWSVDESGQFIRTGAGPHHTHSARHGQIDFVQPLQRFSSFEQPTHLEQNLLLHEKMQQANYGLNSQSFERSASTPRPDMDLINALARLQGVDMQENHGHMNSPGQMGQFHSGSRSQQNLMPNQFTALRSDPMERNWGEPNGQLQNSLTESRLNQFRLAAEKQKRDMQADLSIEDHHQWASLVGNDEHSSHGHHQKLALQSSQPFGLADGAPASSYENMNPSWLFSRPATDHPFNVPVDKMGLDESSVESSLFTNLGQSNQVRSVNLNLEGQVDTFDSSGRLPFRSSSATLAENRQFFGDIGGVEREQLGQSKGGDMLRERLDFSDLKEGTRVKQQGSKSIVMNRSVRDSLEGGIEQAEDHGAVKIKGPVRHASFGGTGGGANLYSYDMGTDNAYVDQMVNNRVSEIFSRGSDSLLKHTQDPKILSSQGLGASSEIHMPPVKVKNSTSFAYSDDIRREPEGSMAAPVSESSSSRKDMRFRRTSSYSDADVPEASFIDMLKGTRKQMPEMDASTGTGESADAGPGGRSSKKKGKKGRQIDPSLLGFKVHSNRIMMGEIQRPE